MSYLSEQIIQTIEELPTEDQREVLDFAEFIWAKRQQSQAIKSETNPASPLGQAQLSFFEVAKDSIGAGEGPGDLSTNPDYLKDYGQ
jgi:hypothetical protein